MDWLRRIIPSSKKVRALVAGVIVAAIVPLGRKVGLDIDAQTAETATYMLMTYIVGQGLADLGEYSRKERDK